MTQKMTICFFTWINESQLNYILFIYYDTSLYRSIMKYHWCVYHARWSTVHHEIHGFNVRFNMFQLSLHQAAASPDVPSDSPGSQSRAHTASSLLQSSPVIIWINDTVITCWHMLVPNPTSDVRPCPNDTQTISNNIIYTYHQRMNENTCYTQRFWL